MGEVKRNMTQDYGTDYGKSNDILGHSNGMIFGYGRVSTKDQNSARQRRHFKINVMFILRTNFLEEIWIVQSSKK